MRRRWENGERVFSSSFSSSQSCRITPSFGRSFLAFCQSFFFGCFCGPSHVVFLILFSLLRPSTPLSNSDDVDCVAFSVSPIVKKRSKSVCYSISPRNPDNDAANEWREGGAESTMTSSRTNTTGNMEDIEWSRRRSRVKGTAHCRSLMQSFLRICRRRHQ